MSEDKPESMGFVGLRAPGERVHLGDGAYAYYDGYQMWLSANAHDSPIRVALDPVAFLNFLKYAKRYWILPK